jgi:nicotinamide-nucleotide amidase
MNSLEEKLKKIHVLCIQHKLSIATAESCTGGYISKLITDQSHSSQYYKGSIIAYSNEIKSDILKVPPELISSHGAVSKDVSIAMARELLNIIHADIALSVTGIMETNDEHSSKDCQVYITTMSLSNEITSYFKLDGLRKDNRLRTVNLAFSCLYDFINKHYLLS